MRNLCAESDCDSPVIARDLCSKHYQRAKYHGTLPPREFPVRECGVCGTRFQGVRSNVRYCSQPCMDRAKYERYLPPRRYTTCEHCGVPLDARRRDAAFCSEKCGSDARNAQASAARWAETESSRQPCRGCQGAIPARRQRNTQYCSDKCKIASRRHQTYGLTKAKLDVLLAQHEVCAICDTDDWGGKGPQVDHCHTSGRVRGVLCTNCNIGLGNFRDDPDCLRRAVEYLEG